MRQPRRGLPGAAGEGHGGDDSEGHRGGGKGHSGNGEGGAAGEEGEAVVDSVVEKVKKR